MFVEALHNYFDGKKNWQRLFLEGGCYWFASTLSQYIPGSLLMINRMEEHCAISINSSLFDVSGKISKCNYVTASDRQISFMRKNYIPKFDTVKLEEFLKQYMTGSNPKCVKDSENIKLKTA